MGANSSYLEQTPFQKGRKLHLKELSPLKNASIPFKHVFVYVTALRKHAYSNIQKISPPKTENFQLKNSYIFHISHRGGSNEYLQSMFLSRNKKNNVYPCKPQFYYIKVGFKGVKIIQVCFRDGKQDLSNWRDGYSSI